MWQLDPEVGQEPSDCELATWPCALGLRTPSNPFPCLLFLSTLPLPLLQCSPPPDPPRKLEALDGIRRSGVSFSSFSSQASPLATLSHNVVTCVPEGDCENLR